MDSSREKITTVVTRIKEKRIDLNYTQAYVAGKLRISQNAYSKIETGLTNFSIERLYQIADVLETDARQFL